MKVTQIFVKVLKDGLKIVFKSPKLWLLFYLFALLDLLIVRFIPGDLSKVLVLLLSLVIVGLPGLKVEFLGLIKKGEKLSLNSVHHLLFYYFKKFLVVNIILLIIGGFFAVISNGLFISLGSPSGLLYGYQLAEIINLIVFLPLAISYFSLFHLFVVILVTEKTGIRKALKLSITYIRKHKQLVIMIVLLSLIVHYPVSEMIMSGSRFLSGVLDSFILRAIVSFVNVIIDLYFFAVWMVLYNKKN